MDAAKRLEAPAIDSGFLADALTKFSERLAALELENQLTVLNPVWKAKCGYADCLWEGESSTDYQAAHESAHHHSHTMHPSSKPIVIVEKNS
jgi:hypothetical protein